ncbi:rna 3 -terminal phosphate cyclase [Fusarium sporotrichioides]|uniref:Rna 3-terminal phosphate cyclase n=1 Tax=Fusarium sporotrichioides TaxID=5514 RepID=A0A395SS84_FUSSP|nr:rna 3 -terminal phosphate cyclase [Fusarium sporotrichioides]
MKPVELDGRTGEGGGQVVRVAVAIAALTGQAVTITNVRGNRDRGGGLKSQHVTSIQYLAEITDADVDGLSVGSKTVTFAPRRTPTELYQRNIKVSAESGSASALLILQAILPFLIFAGNDSEEPVELQISGGTNVSFSLSFEYLDQILLPTLEERFGIQVGRTLERRGWSMGPQSRGQISLKFHPLKIGQGLRYKAPEQRKYPESYEVRAVDVSMVVPGSAHEKLQASLTKDLEGLFPSTEIYFKLTEDTNLDSRWYILLVAHSTSGIRWGHDWLGSLPKKTKNRDRFMDQVSKQLCQGLYKEVEVGGQVDVHLQDQVVVFQALCEGYSSFPRGDGPDESFSGSLIDEMGNLEIGGNRTRKEKTHEPFGYGSLHSQTARWVASEMLPNVEFYNKGDVVKGAGISMK